MTSTLVPDPVVEAPAYALDDDAPVVAPPAPRRAARRRRAHDPRWYRPALLALLVATALLYLWGLGASGWANPYYSAAVQAATRSWKAFLFGSTDSSNFITVDKTPASLWVMGLSARVFGVSSWSILVPQALEGVAAVALLVATVKRWSSAAAALAAGAVLALTPVATLMFRFNNPDALLVLLLVAGAYGITRAVDDGRTRWLVLAGTAVGFAFLAKELQAFLVLPGFASAYLLAGPPRLTKRIGQLAAMGAALLVSAGWWVALVQLWPASDRPYLGGSQDNSFWNVLFGYNGFGRLTGSETGSVGGAGNGTGRWGATGIGRLFNTEFGGQASWLIPTALVLLVGGLVLTARRPRTDRTRAALVLWGGWLLLTGAAISFGAGIIHPYYTVALAPAIGALVAGGGWICWRHRDSWVGRGSLSAAVAIGTWWSAQLLARTPDWAPGLRTAVVVGGVGTAVFLLIPQRSVRAFTVATLVGLAVLLSGPAAYSLSTASTAHSGALPTAGPTVAGAMGGPGGAPGGTAGGGPGGAPGGVPTNGSTTNGMAAGGPPNGFGPSGSTVPSGTGAAPTTNGGFGPQSSTGATAGGRPGGGMGGLLGGTTVGAKLTKLLRTDASEYRWTAAAVGANTAASYQLASDEPVMAIGGFNGSDPAPTLAQFEAYVKAGRIHWFISSGGTGGPGAGSGTTSSIASWVQSHFAGRTLDGVTLYDLTSPTTV